MSVFDRDKYIDAQAYRPGTIPQQGGGVFGDETSWLDSLQTFSESMADNNVVLQTIDKIRGEHYTDPMVQKRRKAREEEEAIVGPKPFYDGFKDPIMQSLPEAYRKYIGGIGSEIEAIAFSEADQNLA